MTPSLLTRLNQTYGTARSLVIYWRPGRQAGLRHLYRHLVPTGAVVFDIGAHVGDRSAAFLALGARVVALEPQPSLAHWCRRMAGPELLLLEQAAGPRAGHAEIAINPANPTISTLAKAWRTQIGSTNQGFAGVTWSQRLQVEVTTLDALIEAHGCPAFIKIDVEGFEAEVLEGLTQPIAALSVEFMQGALEIANRCVTRLDSLADYRFNIVIGEQRQFLWSQWRTAQATSDWLSTGADAIASGDLYACRHDHPLLSSQSHPPSGQ